MMKTTATKTTSVKPKDLLAAIDKRLYAILNKDILKIQDRGMRSAAFLSLIAA